MMERNIMPLQLFNSMRATERMRKRERERALYYCACRSKCICFYIILLVHCSDLYPWFSSYTPLVILISTLLFCTEMPARLLRITLMLCCCSIALYRVGVSADAYVRYVIDGI